MSTHLSLADLGTGAGFFRAPTASGDDPAVRFCEAGACKVALPAEFMERLPDGTWLCTACAIERERSAPALAPPFEPPPFPAPSREPVSQAQALSFAFEDGEEAALAGLGPDFNPHPVGSALHGSWSEGHGNASEGWLGTREPETHR